MFGYVRPLRDSLSQEEYELYRGAYCGLCHCMRKRLGLFSSFTVNYDFAFMAMLLADGQCGTECKRCIAHPFKKRKCVCVSNGMEPAADMSLILACLKLEDDIRDEGFLKSLKARFFRLLLRRGYKKACRDRVDFAGTASKLLNELSELETGCCESIDMTADKFALILSACSEGAQEPVKKRILEHLFYHLGRIIYLTDAIDDLPGDAEDGSYNPVILRYSLDSGTLSDEAAQGLDITLRHSINLIASDFQLLPKNSFSEIVENIIYLGIPTVTSQTLRSRLLGTENITTGDKE